jgi:hypothetical protein
MANLEGEGRRLMRKVIPISAFPARFLAYLILIIGAIGWLKGLQIAHPIFMNGVLLIYILERDNNDLVLALTEQRVFLKLNLIEWLVVFITLCICIATLRSIMIFVTIDLVKLKLRA